MNHRRYKLNQSTKNRGLNKRSRVSGLLKWEELYKAILALNLSVAQIDLSMTEGNYSVDALIDSFNFMREGLENLHAHIMKGTATDEASVNSNMLAETNALSDKVTSSIIAFQFYDRLSQRLHHVSDSLSILSDIMASKDQIVDDIVWQAFIEKMSRYAAMREEHELFDLIFKQGLSSEQAIELMKFKMRERMLESQNNPAAVLDDDIELF